MSQVTLVAGQIASATSSSAVTSLGVSLPNPTGAGNVVLAKASTDTSGGQTINNVQTDKGDTVTQQFLQNVASHGGDVGGYAAKVTTGSQVITAHFSASTSFTAIAAYEVTGNDQTTPVDAAATTSSQDGGTTGTNYTSPSVTPARSGGFIFGACFIGSTVSYSAIGANSPFTLGEEEIANTGTASEYYQQAVAAAIQASFNTTGGTEDHWAVGIITIQPPATPSDSPLPHPRTMRGPLLRFPTPLATIVPTPAPLPGTGATLPPPLQTALEFHGPFARIPRQMLNDVLPQSGATAWAQGSGNAVASASGAITVVPATYAPIKPPLVFRGPFDHIGYELTQPASAQLASAGASQYAMGTAPAVASASGALTIIRGALGTGAAVATASGAATVSASPGPPPPLIIRGPFRRIARVILAPSIAEDTSAGASQYLMGTGSAVASASGTITVVSAVVQAPLAQLVILGGQSQLWIRSIRPKIQPPPPPPSSIDALTGSAAAVATASGAISVLRATTGSAAAVATGTGRLQALRATMGTAAAVATATTHAQALRAFAGTAGAVATGTTKAQALRATAGRGAAVATASGIATTVPLAVGGEWPYIVNLLPASAPLGVTVTPASLIVNRAASTWPFTVEIL